MGAAVTWRSVRVPSGTKRRLLRWIVRVSGDSRLGLELGLLAGATPEGVTKAEGNREAADDYEGGEDIEKDRRSTNANTEPAEHAREGLGLEDEVAQDQERGAERDQARV